VITVLAPLRLHDLGVGAVLIGATFVIAAAPRPLSARPWAASPTGTDVACRSGSASP